MLQCVSLNTPLAFNSLDPVPIPHLTTPDDFPAGDQLRSCPLLLCDHEDLSLAAQYVDPDIRASVVYVLETANSLFNGFFLDPDGSTSPLIPGISTPTTLEQELVLDAILDNPVAVATSVSSLFLQTCALATRITYRTLAAKTAVRAGIKGGKVGIAFDDKSDDNALDMSNDLDAQRIYHHVRFMGLKAWVGLPYVYVWV